jgi:pyrroloquinoline quinone (PQQ) biosynthesis protein C
MRRCGASTDRIDHFVENVRAGLNVASALEKSGAPAPVQEFVKGTFHVIGTGEVCAVASALALGREDLLPDVFRRIVDELNAVNGTELADFRYYLDRHIELDGGEHGQLADRLVEELCGDNQDRWQAAEEAATQSLLARLKLWNGIDDRLSGSW